MSVDSPPLPATPHHPPHPTPPNQRKVLSGFPPASKKWSWIVLNGTAKTWKSSLQDICPKVLCEIMLVLKFRKSWWREKARESIVYLQFFFCTKKTIPSSRKPWFFPFRSLGAALMPGLRRLNLGDLTKEVDGQGQPNEQHQLHGFAVWQVSAAGCTRADVRDRASLVTEWPGANWLAELRRT